MVCDPSSGEPLQLRWPLAAAMPAAPAVAAATAAADWPPLLGARYRELGGDRAGDAPPGPAVPPEPPKGRGEGTGEHKGTFGDGVAPPQGIDRDPLEKECPIESSGESRLAGYEWGPEGGPDNAPRVNSLPSNVSESTCESNMSSSMPYVSAAPVHNVRIEQRG